MTPNYIPGLSDDDACLYVAGIVDVQTGCPCEICVNELAEKDI